MRIIHRRLQKAANSSDSNSDTSDDASKRVVVDTNIFLERANNQKGSIF